MSVGFYCDASDPFYLRGGGDFTLRLGERVTWGHFWCLTASQKPILCRLTELLQMFFVPSFNLCAIDSSPHVHVRHPPTPLGGSVQYSPLSSSSPGSTSVSNVLMKWPLVCSLLPKILLLNKLLSLL